MNLSAADSLVMASGMIDFLLHTSLAFAVCRLVCVLVSRARSRFGVWLGFLIVSAGYWLWLSLEWVRFCWPHTTAPTIAGPADSAVMETARVHSPQVLSVSSRWAAVLPWAMAVLAAVYVIVVLYRLAAMTRSHSKLRAVLRFTTNPSAEMAVRYEELRQVAGVKEVCRVRVLAGIGSPATVGWLRPIILLPEGLQASSELADILRHELHHVRRRDFLWDNVAGICAALLCFHPTVYYALRRLRFERELACDLAVIAESPGRRAEYAECLLHFARQEQDERRLAWGIDFAARSGHLKARLRGILARDRRLPIWLVGVRGAAALVFLAGMLVALPVLGVQLRLAAAPVARMLDRAGIATPAPVMHRLMKRTLRSPAVSPGAKDDRNASVPAEVALNPDKAPIAQAAVFESRDTSRPTLDVEEASQSQPVSVGGPQSQDDAPGGQVAAMPPMRSPAGSSGGIGAVVVPIGTGGVARAGVVPWAAGNARSRIGMEKRRQR